MSPLFIWPPAGPLLFHSYVSRIRSRQKNETKVGGASSFVAVSPAFGGRPPALALPATSVVPAGVAILPISFGSPAGTLRGFTLHPLIQRDGLLPRN